MTLFDELIETFGGEPIPRCPGRYVLRRVGATDGLQGIVDSAHAMTEHSVPTARDTVVVTWLDNWGLISYHRADGTWLHTANTPEGFRRKLTDLGIPLLRGQASTEGSTKSSTEPLR